MLVNLTKTFSLPIGQTQFSDLGVRVRVAGSNNPTRLYSPDGVLNNKQGLATLDAEGKIDVWVASGLLFNLELYSLVNGFTFSRQLGVDPQNAGGSGTGMTPTQEYQLSALWEAAVNGGDVMPAALTFEAQQTVGTTIQLSNMILDGNPPGNVYTEIDWGDGQIDGVGPDLRTATIDHAYSAEGSYSVVVVPYNDTNVRGGSATQRVPVSPPVAGPFEIYVGRYTNTNIIEVGWYINLNWNGTVIDWGDGQTTTLDDTDVLASTAHDYATEGVYTITVTEHTDVGGEPTGRVGTLEFDMATVEDYGDSPYGPNGEASSDDAIVSLTPVRFRDTTRLLEELPTSWLWDFDDGTTSTEQNPTHTFTTIGVYSVTLSVNGSAATPINFGQTINVIAEPTAPAVTTQVADDFTGDGPVKNRALTTPMAGVFDVWDATETTTPVTLDGELAATGAGIFSQASLMQWKFGAPVVPPAALQEFVAEFDFKPDVINEPSNPYSYAMQWSFGCAGSDGGTVDGYLFNFSVQAGLSTDDWSFRAWAFDQGSQTKTVTSHVPRGDSVHVKLVLSDTEAYIRMGATDIMMFDVSGRGTRGPVNSVQLQFGPPAGGNLSMDNFVISSIN